MDFLDSLEQGASDLWGSFDLNRFITTASQAYATIKKADQPATALATPGAIRRLPDGSTARVNPDGSLTIISATGGLQTIGTGGQIALGAPWIPGVPNVVLLGAGAVVLALLFLKR